MKRRAVLAILVLVCVVLAAGALGWRGRGAIAVWLAPGKTPSSQMSEKAKSANAKFWDVFHAGRYDEVDDVIEALTAAYLEDPRDTETTAHIAFAHVWKQSEAARLDKLPARITDHIVLARKYFSEAVQLAPHDQRYRGFHAGMELAEGALHAEEKLTRRGYYDLMKSIDGWPEFNLFTAGYIFSRLPHTEARYADAVEYQWRNLDVCAQEKVDRRTVKYDQYMSAETTEGPKRACWNSWIAPHNFEGFFLNMGDMIVKQGDPALARRAYANAKLSKTYEAWPFKSVLEERIAQAEENVARFRNPPSGEKTRTIMIMSTFACAGCHQQ
jgi:hypothetical protein